MGDGREARTAADDARENDALHILPLRLIRLQTRALSRARIIKNVRLEGMIELFADDRAGSGQVRANELPKFIDMRGPERTDLVIVERLCDLPSYDVYSLRTSLKELGIKTENVEGLSMSKVHAQRLSGYVRAIRDRCWRASMARRKPLCWRSRQLPICSPMAGRSKREKISFGLPNVCRSSFVMCPCLSASTAISRVRWPSMNTVSNGSRPGSIPSCRRQPNSDRAD